MKASNLTVHEVIELPINTGSFVATGVENGKPYTFRGVTWRYVGRYAEELRKYYRLKYGRDNYRVSVNKQRRDGRALAQIIAFGPPV